MTDFADPVDRWLAANPTARREGRWDELPSWMLADVEVRARLGVPDAVPYPKIPERAGMLCTDPDCPDHDDEDDDDPWAGRPVAKPTFRQRWLTGSRVLWSWRFRNGTRTLVVSCYLRSWGVMFQKFPYVGGEVQIGPFTLTFDEPPL